MASNAPELTYEQALALDKEIVEAFTLKQEELHRIWSEHAGNKIQQQKARVQLLSPIQHQVISKYGFQPSMAGVGQSIMAYKPWSHHKEIHELTMKMTYLWDPELAAKYPTMEDWEAHVRENIPPPKPDKSAKPKPFTLADAISMQGELIARYSSDEYQKALKEEFIAAAGNKEDFNKAKNDLNFRLVLTHVLERYGFENSKKGAFLSFQAFAPYNSSDPIVMENNTKLSYYNNPENQDVSLEEYLEKNANARHGPTGLEKSANAKVDDKGSGYNAGSNPAVATVSSTPEVLTKSRAIEIQEELIAGYRSLDFQNDLRRIEEEAKGDRKLFMPARSDLLFEKVQSHVLPRYGYENSKRGVMAIQHAFLPLDSDPDVKRNNLVMQYLTLPSLQEVGLETFLEENLKPKP